MIECYMCDAEFTVASDTREAIAFCPFCGADIVDSELATTLTSEEED